MQWTLDPYLSLVLSGSFHQKTCMLSGTDLMNSGREWILGSNVSTHFTDTSTYTLSWYESLFSSANCSKLSCFDSSAAEGKGKA